MELIVRSKDDNIDYKFDVENSDNLTSIEVKMICDEMNVRAIFVNGKFYENN